MLQHFKTKLKTVSGYVVCRDEKCAGVFEKFSDNYKDLELGMDHELIEWLNTQTFPEEAKYKDADYAKKA